MFLAQVASDVFLLSGWYIRIFFYRYLHTYHSLGCAPRFSRVRILFSRPLSVSLRARSDSFVSNIFRSSYRDHTLQIALLLWQEKCCRWFVWSGHETSYCTCTHECGPCGLYWSSKERKGNAYGVFVVHYFHVLIRLLVPRCTGSACLSKLSHSHARPLVTSVYLAICLNHAVTTKWYVWMSFLLSYFVSFHLSLWHPSHILFLWHVEKVLLSLFSLLLVFFAATSATLSFSLFNLSSENSLSLSVFLCVLGLSCSVFFPISQSLFWISQRSFVLLFPLFICRSFP